MLDLAKPPRRERSLADTLQAARGWTSYGGLVLAIVGLLAIGFAPFGVHEAMFDLDYATGVVVLGWANLLAILAVVAGVVALLMALLIPPRRGLVVSLTTLALAAAALVAVGQVRVLLASNPPVHEVSTDWADPLTFGPSFLVARGPDANRVLPDPRVGVQRASARMEGMRVADLNARGCPAAVPAVMIGSVEQAYAKSRAALLAQGFTLVTENPAAGRLEATTATRWLKLTGDVVVRIRPEGAGARIDIRSVSRTGEIDLGENCRRVERLRRALAG